MVSPISGGFAAIGSTGPITRPTIGATGGMPTPTGGDALGSVGGSGDGGFAAEIGDALRGVEQTQQVADGLAQQAATGQLTDVHDYMIASTQAQLATELTVAVRNKALESFNEIMRMQV